MIGVGNKPANMVDYYYGQEGYQNQQRGKLMSR